MSAADRQRLLELARYALEARVRRGPAPTPLQGGALDDCRGVFVSLHRLGELRGCLGSLDRDAPLGIAVVRLAALVADSDPRFMPVVEAELAGIDIEISVLTPARVIHGVDAIEIGRHGVIVERGRRRGLLLPRVAIDHGWNRDTLLAHVCLKAGLPPDGWRDQARLLVFEACVFGERGADG